MGCLCYCSNMLLQVQGSVRVLSSILSSVLVVRATLVGLGGLRFLKKNMSVCLLVSLIIWGLFAFSSLGRFQGILVFWGGFAV